MMLVFLRAFDLADVAPLIVAALRKLGKELSVDLLWSLVHMKGFRAVRDRLHAIRDAAMRTTYSTLPYLLQNGRPGNIENEGVPMGQQCMMMNATGAEVFFGAMEGSNANFLVLWKVQVQISVRVQVSQVCRQPEGQQEASCNRFVRCCVAEFELRFESLTILRHGLEAS